MKIALFSDIHANLPALQAVLADIDARNPDLMVCLGDLVGYAPFPNEVVQLMYARKIPTIAGNYDVGVGINSDDCGCAYKTEDDRARGALSIQYTNSTIGDEERAYLRQLPRHLSLDFESNNLKIKLLMVHGSPRKVNEYLFEDRSEKSLLHILEQAGADILVCGHTHKPYHKVLQRAGRLPQHVINIGSVGKPKDGDTRACYVWLEINMNILTTDYDLSVEFIRVPYDVELVASAIEQSPLPNEFADMLRKAY